jgi:hypothetical protein
MTRLMRSLVFVWPSPILSGREVQSGLWGVQSRFRPIGKSLAEDDADIFGNPFLVAPPPDIQQSSDPRGPPWHLQKRKPAKDFLKYENNRCRVRI